MFQRGGGEGRFGNRGGGNFSNNNFGQAGNGNMGDNDFYIGGGGGFRRGSRRGGMQGQMRGGGPRGGAGRGMGGGRGGGGWGGSQKGGMGGPVADAKASKPDVENRSESGYLQDHPGHFPDQFWCKICNAKTTGPNNYAAHLNGVRHKQNVMNLQVGDPLVRVGPVAQRKRKRDSENTVKRVLSEMLPENKEPIVGLEFVTEIIREGSDTDPDYECELCDCRTLQGNIIYHLIGFRHRMAYIKKNKPDVAAMLDNLAKMVAEEDIPKGDGSSAQSPEEKEASKSRASRSRVSEKLKQIIPDLAAESRNRNYKVKRVAGVNIGIPVAKKPFSAPSGPGGRGGGPGGRGGGPGGRGGGPGGRGGGPGGRGGGPGGRGGGPGGRGGGRGGAIGGRGGANGGRGGANGGRGGGPVGRGGGPVGRGGGFGGHGGASGGFGSPLAGPGGATRGRGGAARGRGGANAGRGGLGGPSSFGGPGGFDGPASFGGPGGFDEPGGFDGPGSFDGPGRFSDFGDGGSLMGSRDLGGVGLGGRDFGGVGLGGGGLSGGLGGGGLGAGSLSSSLDGGLGGNLGGGLGAGDRGQLGGSSLDSSNLGRGFGRGALSDDNFGDNLGLRDSGRGFGGYEERSDLPLPSRREEMESIKNEILNTLTSDSAISDAFILKEFERRFGSAKKLPRSDAYEDYDRDMLLPPGLDGPRFRDTIEEQDRGGFQRLESSQDYSNPTSQPFMEPSSQHRTTVSLDQLSRLDPIPNPSTGLKSCLKKPMPASSTTSASAPMRYEAGGQPNMATSGSQAVQEIFSTLSQSMITNETDAQLAKQVTDTLSQALQMYESKHGGDRPEPGFGEPPRNRGLLPPPPFGPGFSRM